MSFRRKGKASDIAKIPKALKKLYKTVGVECMKESKDGLTGALQSSFNSGETAMGSSRPQGKNGPVDLVQSGTLQGTLSFKRRGTKAYVTLPNYARYLFKFGILPPAGARPPSWIEILSAGSKIALERLFGNVV